MSQVDNFVQNYHENFSLQEGKIGEILLIGARSFEKIGQNRVALHLCNEALGKKKKISALVRKEFVALKKKIKANIKELED